jgi:hypothetical protein
MDDLKATEEDLRVASDNFLTRVERLHALEEQKRELPPDETAAMAHEVEALTREILEWAKRQTTLAEEAAQPGNDPGRPIAIVGPRPLPTVLADWRAAERRMQDEQPGTATWESARADVDRLRDEYARAYHAQTNGEQAARTDRASSRH